MPLVDLGPVKKKELIDLGPAPTPIMEAIGAVEPTAEPKLPGPEFRATPGDIRPIKKRQGLLGRKESEFPEGLLGGKPSLPGPQFRATPKDVRPPFTAPAGTRMTIGPAKRVTPKPSGWQYASPIEKAVYGFDESKVNHLLERFGKQFTNAFARVGETIISHPLSPIGIRQREAQPYRAQAAKELEASGFRGGPPQAEELIRARSAALAAAKRVPKFQIEPQKGIEDKVVDVGAGLAAFIAQLALLKKVLPKGTPDPVIWEIQNQSTGGIPGQGATMRLTLGSVGKIPVGSLKGKLAKVGLESGLFAGVTAATGGNVEDVIIAGLIPVAFNAWGFAKQRQHITKYERNLKTQALQKHQQRLKQGMNPATSQAYLKADKRVIDTAVAKAKQIIYRDDAFAPAREKWEAQRKKALDMIATGKPAAIKRGNAILDFLKGKPLPTAKPIETQIKEIKAAGKAVSKEKFEIPAKIPQRPAKPVVPPKIIEKAVVPPAEAITPPKPPTVAPEAAEELAAQRGTFQKYQKSMPNATEQEIVRFMIEDGLRPPSAVLKRNEQMPEVQEISAQDKTEEVARIQAPKPTPTPAEPTPAPETKDEYRARVRAALAKKKITKPKLVDLGPAPKAPTKPAEPEIIDLSDKTRKKALKQTEQKITEHEIYQNEIDAIETAEREIGPGYYYVTPELKGEVLSVTGKPGQKGFKPELYKSFTFTDPTATSWAKAAQERGIEDIDISEFVQRVDDAIEAKKKVGALNQQALERAIASKDPYFELLAMKREMLKDGLSAAEINDNIREQAKYYGMPESAIKDQLVAVERIEVKDVEAKQRVAEEVARKGRKAKAKLSPEQAAIKKAKTVARKLKAPAYAYEKHGRFVVSKNPPTKGPYTKVSPPVAGELTQKITKGASRIELTPEQIQQATKLHHDIHEIAAKKGLTKKALSDLSLKHTGYRQFTGKIARKKIGTDQLESLYKAVQKTRPKRVGYKRVITQKTENKIQSLKENLIKKTQMTEPDFAEILQMEVYGKPPKYIDAKRFITETEGKDIIKRMLKTAEIIRVTESFNQAVAKNPEIADQIKILDRRIKPPKRDPWSLESMRYYNQQAQLKTGAPIYDMYMDLLDTHLEVNKTRTATWKRLQASTPRFKAIARDKAALKRVGDYIASKSALKEKPPMPKDITTEEIKLAKQIEKILEEYRFKVRAAKFFNWYYYNQPIPDHEIYKTQIAKAVDIYESKGHDDLIEYLKTQDWGVIHSGYEPLDVLFRKIRPYTTGPTTVGKTHIRIRTDIQYHTQERTILQRLASYMRQVDMLFNLSPKINAYVQLYEDNMAKFNNPRRVQENIEIFLRNLKRYNIQGGFFERTLARLYSQAMRTIIMPSPVLSFRNLFQNPAFEHDKTILIDPRNKTLTDKDIDYLETYVLQTRGMVEEWFMVGEKPLPGLKFLTGIVDKVKVYPHSDIANRHWGFWAKKNQVDRALKAKTVKAMMTEAKFEDITELEQKRALSILARDGKEAFARYVSRIHVDDIHFLYERSQRSPAEMSPLGRVVGNLMLFPRAYGEKLAHAARKLISKRQPFRTRYRSLKILFAVIAGGMFVGAIYKKITGRKRNPYNPLEILAYQPGGLAWGAVESASDVYNSILMAAAGDKRALASLTTQLPRASDMFIPFYDYTLRGLEAATDQKNIDRKALRQMRMMIDKEYKIRGGAYKLQRTTLEKWQYFIGGAGVDQKIQERQKGSPARLKRKTRLEREKRMLRK